MSSCNCLIDCSKQKVECTRCAETHVLGCKVQKMDEDLALYCDEWYCKDCTAALENLPSANAKGLQKIRTHILPQAGWYPHVVLEDIPDEIIGKVSSTPKNRKGGWTLFQERKFTVIESNKERPPLVFYRAVASAEMKSADYQVSLCFKVSAKDEDTSDGCQGIKYKWSYCSCPGGANGDCKHCVGFLYTLADFCRRGELKFSDVTCTSRLQMWHVRKPTSDDPLLFAEVQFKKHDPDKPLKSQLGSNVLGHNPVPAYAKVLKSNDLRLYCENMKRQGLALPVIDLLESAGFPTCSVRKESNFPVIQALFEGLDLDLYYVAAPFVRDLDKRQKQVFDDLVSLSLKAAKQIEVNTRYQSQNQAWFECRAFRITASMFGSICKQKSLTSTPKVFEQKRKFFTAPSVQHGMHYEESAFVAYSALMQERNVSLSESRLGWVVSPKFPYLGGSPDRVVLKDGVLTLVEIKCPFTLFKKGGSIRNFASRNKNFYLETDHATDQLVLKKQHDYFYQIQGLLCICNIQVCDLVVFVPPSSIEVIKVKRDCDFFEPVSMKLTAAYFYHLLPHFENML